MAPFITLLDNLHPRFSNSIIKVRCVRVFEGYSGDKNDHTLEAVFHDSKGIRIQASFPNSFCQKIGAKLKEGGLFCIINFFVKTNNLWNRSTNHKYRLAMLAKTEMVQVEDPKFENYMFDFKTCNIPKYGFRLNM